METGDGLRLMEVFVSFQDSRSSAAQRLRRAQILLGWSQFQST
jgi:hypothetical protein